MSLYLYTDPDQTDAPMWVFHLPSFTLARLELSHDPAEPTKFICQQAQPSDVAFRAFSDFLAGFAVKPDRNFLMITSPAADPQLPVYLTMTSTGVRDAGFLLLDARNRVAVAYSQQEGPIGPIWAEQTEDQKDSRDVILTNLFSSVEDREIYDTLLDVSVGYNYYGTLWLERPDTLASSAQPSSPASP